MHDDHDHDNDNPWADRINEAYYDALGASFGQKTRERINWMCAQARGGSVLDVGCSQGIASVLMAREGLAVTGLDIYPPAIEYAMAERAKEIASVQERLSFRCGELAALEGEHFDTVVMGEVIEHQTNPDRFIRQGAALVAPGGRIVITVPYGLHPWPDHKSTLFPRVLHEAIADAFAMTTIEVTDGYIRVVADRRAAGVAAQDDANALLRATEAGALDAQSSYYAVNATAQEHAKSKAALETTLRNVRAEQDKLVARRIELERDLAVRTEQAAALTETKAQLAKQSERAESLMQRTSDLQAELAQVRAAEVAGRKLQLDLQAKIEQAQGETRKAHDKAQDEARKAQEELRKAQDETRKAQERITALDAGVRASEQKTKALHAELLDAQEKRSGHWAKYEAENARSHRLIELAQNLHAENQRYESSIALAIGRAMLGLGSVRGILGFPRAMLGVVRLYRRRNGGEIVIPPLALPPLAPVVQREAKNKAAEQARRLGDEQKKKLAVIGWEQPNPAGSLPVMSVLDEFSRACFAPHANLIEPRPDNWEGLLEKFEPRFLFAESAWRGNRGAWRHRLARMDHPPGKEFAQMVEGFRKRGVPTVFWNKEDPVHFNAFIETAARCDVILTTSAESVERYRERTGARIGVMQFAAEDSLHNPQGSSKRNGKVCFAGSYYAESFEARQDGHAMLLEAAQPFGLDIFDRNHGAPGAKNEFAFPERFAPYIRGKLDFEALSRKYREYSVFLNVNSVSESSTMFSRRVFELLACGTPVVSTWSRGIQEAFGDDIVWQVRNRAEADEALRVLTTDPAEWRRRSLAGIRAVLSHHTYRHRFAKVLALVDAPAPEPTQVVAIARVGNAAEAESVLDAFGRQRSTDDVVTRLMLACRSGFTFEASRTDVRMIDDAEASLAALVDRVRAQVPGALVAVLAPHAVYGPHHLQDAVHAVRYSGALVVGRSRADIEYEWGHAPDPAAWIVDTGALAAKGRDATPLFEADGSLAAAMLADCYLFDRLDA